MSEVQADTLRRLIDRYADAAREVGRTDERQAKRRADALRQMDEARERLDTLLAVMTRPGAPTRP